MSKTQMQTAMDELMRSPEFIAAEQERLAREAEHARLSEIPLIMLPDRMGTVQKKRTDGSILEEFYAMRLVAQDEDGAVVQNILPVPKEFMTKFVMEEQEFGIDTEISGAMVPEVMEWIETQTHVEAWSLVQRVHRRRPKDPSGRYVFSLSDKHSASMFKMFFG